MRLIGNLPDQKQAEQFTAHLLTQGVHSQVDNEDGKFEIWIKDEDQIDVATKSLDDFRLNPDDTKYRDAVSRARAIQEAEIKKRTNLAKNVVQVSGGKVPRNHPLTISLIVICGIVGLLTNFGALNTQATFRALAFNGVADPAATELLIASDGDVEAPAVRFASLHRGEAWRLVTPIFLHHDVFHLLFNMYWLFLFGSQIEHRYGSFWLGLLVIVSAAFSNFVQCAVPIDVGGSAPGMLGGYLVNGLGGMSGVVFALFGFVLMRMTYDRSSGLFVPQSTVIILLAWLVFCMTPMATSLGFGQVANWAHTIGLLVGLIAGYWPILLAKQ